MSTLTVTASCQDAPAGADVVALALPALCELVWALAQGCKIPAADIMKSIRLPIDAGNAVVNRPAVQAGVAALGVGGDFADGVIAYEGRWLGAEAFVSFDRKAVQLLATQGQAAHLLA